MEVPKVHALTESLIFYFLKTSVLKKFKDTLKAFDDFGNKQQKCMT